MGGEPEFSVPPTPAGKEEFARMHTVVRDGVVSFMFHHWQPSEDLYDTIQRLQALSYRFISVNNLLAEYAPAYK